MQPLRPLGLSLLLFSASVLALRISIPSPHTNSSSPDISRLRRPTNALTVDRLNLSDNLWPPCPYYDKVPDRKGNPYILVTEHDRKDHGDKAGVLAKVVCNQMLAWLLFLPQASYIHEEHWESNSYGDIHAIEYSIFMEMAPIKANENLRANDIDRETAYYAMQEFCNLVAVFGAMQGNFEFWSYGHKRMTGTMHIFEWPSGARAQE